MTRATLAAPLALLLAGCAALGPGMHMSESSVEEKGTEERPVRIIPVTAALLGEQAKARAAAGEGGARDPLAPEEDRWQYRVSPYVVLSAIVWEHPELPIPA